MEFFKSGWPVEKSKVSTYLNMHSPARLSHTCLEQLDRHGSEVGQKKDKKICFHNRVARSIGGVTWRHGGVFFNLSGPLESLKCFPPTNVHAMSGPELL